MLLKPSRLARSLIAPP